MTERQPPAHEPDVPGNDATPPAPEVGAPQAHEPSPPVNEAAEPSPETAVQPVAESAASSERTDVGTPGGVPPAGEDGGNGMPLTPSGGRRRRRIPRGLAPLALIAGLAVAWLLPSAPFLALGGGPASAAGDDLHIAIGNLPDQPTVLVDMDPDLGTYPEIRFATRAALADLFAVGARVAMISFSPEGRAIAVAEIARLRNAGAGPDRLVDLGFRSGGEAALVQLTGQPIDHDVGGATSPVLAGLQARGGGLGAFDLALVVGGNDMGPRTWIEQIEPRVPKLPVAAITPTFLLPQVQPYRDSGQLVALAGTLPEGAAYGQSVAAAGASTGPAQVPGTAPNAAAILLGMLVALVVLVESGLGAFFGSVRGTLRGWRP